jgi:hypothetical protein
MAEEFLPNCSTNIPKHPTSRLYRRDREAVRVLIVGSRRGIMAIVHQLHQKDFAQADEWSNFQPEPHTGQLMRVVTKYVGLESSDLI